MSGTNERGLRLLFVCVGNSCRSQMAEGWARHLGFETASAGTHPAGTVAPNAVKVMAEVGIDISGQTPSHIDEYDHDRFDKVFSMGCGVSCPSIPFDGDWDLNDPVGKDLDTYRVTRDRIRNHLSEVVSTS